MKRARSMTLIASTAMLLLAMGCASYDPSVAQSAGLGDVLTQPEQYLSRSVKVSAPVSGVVSSTSFTLGDGDGTLLVLLPINAKVDVAPTSGQAVAVSGRVRMFSDLAADSDWARLNQTAYDGYRNKPVLVASTVRRAS